MPPRRTMVAFALRFFAILGVYLLPFAMVGIAYSSAAAALGNATLSPFFRGLGVELVFVGADASSTASMESAFGVQVRATDLVRNVTVPLLLDLRTLTYVPSAVFVALTIAAPIWQRRRGFYVLGLGLAALHVFFATSIAVTLALSLWTTLAPQGAGLGQAGQLFFQVFHRVFVAPPGMAMAVPGCTCLLLLWLVPERGHRAPPGRAPAGAAASST